MTSNADRALEDTLQTIQKIGRDTVAMRERANELLDTVRPLLVGKRVRRYGRTYQIASVHISLIGNEIAVSGVTVSKTGKVGRRQFDVGLLRMCEDVR